MTSLKKTIALACVASMLGMGVAMAQTDPTPAAGDAMAAPAGDAMMAKKPSKGMSKKHMSMKKKKMMKKDAM